MTIYDDDVVEVDDDNEEEADGSTCPSFAVPPQPHWVDSSPPPSLPFPSFCRPNLHFGLPLQLLTLPWLCPFEDLI